MVVVIMVGIIITPIITIIQSTATIHAIDIILVIVIIDITIIAHIATIDAIIGEAIVN